MLLLYTVRSTMTDQTDTKMFEIAGVTILGVLYVVFVIHSLYQYMLHPHYWEKPYVREAQQLGLELVHRDEERFLLSSSMRSLIFANPKSIQKVAPYITAELITFSSGYRPGSEGHRTIALFDCGSKRFITLPRKDGNGENQGFRSDGAAMNGGWSAMSDQMTKYFCKA